MLFMSNFQKVLSFSIISLNVYDTSVRCSKEHFLLLADKELKNGPLTLINYYKLGRVLGTRTIKINKSELKLEVEPGSLNF